MAPMIEQWRPVVGFEDLYAVSDQGRVRRIGRSRGTRPDPIMGARLSKKGYARVSLHDGPRIKDVLVHKLVLTTFVGEQPDLFCNHKNGIKADNRLANLEWVTAQQNTDHALRLGLMKRRRLLRYDDELDLLGPLPWQAWNLLPQPDGMAILGPAGENRFGRHADVLYSEFLRARADCTLIDRREAS